VRAVRFELVGVAGGLEKFRERHVEGIGRRQPLELHPLQGQRREAVSVKFERRLRPRLDKR